MPMAPAADTAATSSGLLHGYMAPQMSGTSMPACAVKLALDAEIRIPLEAFLVALHEAAGLGHGQPFVAERCLDGAADAGGEGVLGVLHVGEGFGGRVPPAHVLHA